MHDALFKERSSAAALDMISTILVNWLYELSVLSDLKDIIGLKATDLYLDDINGTTYVYKLGKQALHQYWTRKWSVRKTLSLQDPTPAS